MEVIEIMPIINGKWYAIIVNTNYFVPCCGGDHETEQSAQKCGEWKSKYMNSITDKVEIKTHECEGMPVAVFFYHVVNWPVPFWEMWIDKKIHFDVIGCPFCLEKL